MKTTVLLSPLQLPLQLLSATTNTTLSTSHPVTKPAFDATGFFRGNVLILHA